MTRFDTSVNGKTHTRSRRPMRLSTEQLVSDTGYLSAIEALIAHLDLGILEKVDLPEVTLPDAARRRRRRWALRFDLQ